MGIDNNAHGNLFENIIVKNCTSNGVDWGGYSSGFKNVRSTNNGGRGFNGSGWQGVVMFCETDNNTSDGILSGNYRIFYLYSHDNSGVGIYLQSEGTFAFGCISDTNGSAGIRWFYSGSPIFIINNMITKLM